MIQKFDTKLFNSSYDLIRYAFQKPDTMPRKESYRLLLEHSIALGSLTPENQVMNQVLVFPYTINFHNVVFKTGGIGSVASYPEYSGGGRASQAMIESVHEMYRQGMTLAYLAPFSFEFYRRFGFEQAIDRYHYQVKAADFPIFKEKKGEIVRQNFSESTDLICELNRLDERFHQGALIRDAWWMDYLAIRNPEWQTAVYYDDQHKTQGYLTYQILNGQFVIQELSYLNQASLHALLQFVGNHRNSVQTFNYASCDPQAVHDLFVNPYIFEIQLESYMMARIVNVEDFLMRYPYQHLTKDWTITIKINDEQLSENTGVWEVAYTNGKINVQKISEIQEVDFSLDIQTLTKGMLGYRSLVDLEKFDHADGSKARISEFDQHLIQTQNRLSDYF